jgi:hypothetical protein
MFVCVFVVLRTLHYPPTSAPRKAARQDEYAGEIALRDAREFCARFMLRFPP